MIKQLFTISSLIAAMTIISCGNTDSSKPAANPSTPTTEKPATDAPVAEAPPSDGKSSLTIGGTYRYGTDPDKGAAGSVMIYPLNDNTVMFFLDVSRGAPSYNSGQLLGQMTIKDNVGTYDAKQHYEYLDCTLTFEFSGDQLTVTTGDGKNDCGFGHGVYADNTYKLADKSIPSYFINMAGDTFQFKGLTVEKYENG